MRGIAASPAVLLLAAVIGTLAFAAACRSGFPGKLVFSARFDESGGPVRAPASTPFVAVRNAERQGGRAAARRRGRHDHLAPARALPRWAPTGAPARAAATRATSRSTAAASACPIHTAARGASERVVATAVFKGGEACRLQRELGLAAPRRSIRRRLDRAPGRRAAPTAGPRRRRAAARLEAEHRPAAAGARGHAA